MTEDEMELRVLEAYVSRFDEASDEPDKCARELDLRSVIAGLTDESSRQLERRAEIWLRRLAPSTAGEHAGPLRRCSDGRRNQGEHRFHLRAFLGASGAPAWDRIRDLKRVVGSQSREHNAMLGTSSIRVFISHASEDVALAEALIDMLRAALNLEARAIRCTSVDGYRLPGGANTDEQLRIEVHDSDTFVGIVSNGSLRSLYVLFELGARWGAGKRLIPLLAPGTPASVLGGPLSGLNALRASERAQLVQLVNELAESLGLRAESASVYQRQLDAVLKIAPASDTVSEGTPAPVGRPLSAEDRDVFSGLGEPAKELLLEAAKDSNGAILFLSAGACVQTNGREFVVPESARSASKWRQALSELHDFGLAVVSDSKGEVFTLTDAGFRMADLLGAQA